MSEDNTRNRIVKVTFERFVQFFRRDAADVCVFTLPEHLHAIVGEMLEKTVESKTGPIHINFAKIAIKIGVFVYQLKAQAVCVFE